MKNDICKDCVNYNDIEFCQACEFNTFQPDNPEVKEFIQKFITDLFNRYRKQDIISAPILTTDEIEVCEACIHYYPDQPSKQEALAFCVMFGILASDPLTFKSFAEDIVMPLAIEMGVEKAIIKEILSIRSRKILEDN